MMHGKKPLHTYEQSMLLAAMLFDKNNLVELLKFFPENQAERLHSAKDQFVSLSRHERMTKIVLELRRLLLIDEHRIDGIHESWIDSALSREPRYLRDIIEPSKARRLNKDAPTKMMDNKFPSSLVFSIFVEQLTKTPQKTAIYDPALMRLQSLRDERQDENFFAIGQAGIIALTKVCGEKLIRYLKRKGAHIPDAHDLPWADVKLFENADLRKYYLQELIRFSSIKHLNLTTYAGLSLAALYLSKHKYQWQRIIVLGLHENLGRVMEATIVRAKNVSIDQHHHAVLSRLLIGSLDQRH